MLLHLCAVTNISEMGAGVMGGVLMWNVTSSRIPFKYLHMPRSAAVTSLRPTCCHIWGLPDLHAITCRALRQLRPPLLTLVKKKSVHWHSLLKNCQSLSDGCRRWSRSG